MPRPLPVLTPAEFKQLAQAVFTLVQRERTEAAIDVSALTGKALTAEETAQVRRLLALYFGELAGRAMDEQKVLHLPSAT